jgi:hypothetical protein
MRLWGAVLASAALFSSTSFAPDRAHAQEWNATLVTSAGYTQQPVGDETDITLTMNVVPSVALTWLVGNATHRLAYAATVSYFPVAETDQSAISNNASWQTAWQSGPVSTWLFDLGVAHTQNAALTLVTDPGAGPSSGVSALPTQTLTLSAGQGYARELGPAWRFTEGLVGSYLTPLGDNAEAAQLGETWQGTFALGLDRSFRRSNLGVQALAGVVSAEVTDLRGMQEVQETGTGTLLFRYTRELALRWSAEAFAGTSLVLRLDTDQGAFAPTFGAGATWLGDVGQVNASASRTTTFNPFLAQTLLTDQVTIAGSRPLARSPVLLAGTLSYAHSRTIVSSNPDSEVLDTFTADSSVGYELSQYSALGVRYQYIYIASDSALFADGSRHSLLVTYTARWPRELRTVMPVRQPLRMLRAPQIEEPGSGGRPRPPNAL